MSEIKRERAYCIELSKVITPYLARELYFNEDSDYYNKKLHFKCDKENCEAMLTGVNIYNDKKFKIPLHFRTIKKQIHTCENEMKDEVSGSKSNDIAKSRITLTRYPSEFILNPSKSETLGGNIVEIEDDKENDTQIQIRKGSREYTQKIKRLKISCFEHLIDCYLNGDKDILKNINLTINNKTKKFYNYFKQLKYYRDEEGLIYFGRVEKIENYGNDVKIVFKDRIWDESKPLKASIYIKNKVIDSYGKKIKFRNEINEIIKKKDYEILCFFIGTYPKIEERKSKEGNYYKQIQVEINNLNHLLVTFNK